MGVARARPFPAGGRGSGRPIGNHGARSASRTPFETRLPTEADHGPVDATGTGTDRGVWSGNAGPPIDGGRVATLGVRQSARSGAPIGPRSGVVVVVWRGWHGTAAQCHFRARLCGSSAPGRRLFHVDR